MKLSHILVGGGFVIVLLSFFPLAESAWLPRSIQLLIGSIALIAGVCLVEVAALIEGRAS